jgi:hypothetical protein
MTQMTLAESMEMAITQAEVNRRVQDALLSKTISQCAWAVVYQLTGQHKAYGRKNAVTIQQIQEKMARNWSDRVIKAAVKELIEEHEVPIGSARGASHPGYFLIVDEEDRAAAERPLRGELISLAKRLRTINPHSQLAQALYGQLKLEEV